MTATDKIVESKLVILLARGGMILATPLLATIIAVAGWYFSSQSDVAAATLLRVEQVERVQATHAQDLALLRQADTTDQIRRDRDQAEIKAQLERLQSSVSQLSNSVAALTAVLEAERRVSR